MANERRAPVRYKKFQTNPLLAEGLLPVARTGGDLERRTARMFFGLANKAGQFADREAALNGAREGRADAIAGAPGASTIVPGSTQPGRSSVQAPGAIRATISEAATRHGVNPETMLKIAELESTFNPGAQNRDTSAGGLFQFVDGTAKQYGLQDRFDPAQASDAAARLARDNAAHLRKVLGREPTTGELYLAHQQGAGGASKLLRNPSANAASLVGVDAVRLNGGSVDMSAQAFANLWISKASAPGTILSGKPGTFQTTGSATIRGQAYDTAGARTYLQSLDTTMRTDMQTVYDTYGDDPAKLEKSLGELKQAHLSDHVFEDIAPDYIVAFDRSSQRLVQRSRDVAERKREARDRAEFLERIDDLEENKSRSLAGLEDGESAEGLFSVQSSIDAHYDDAVERGILTEKEATRAKDRSMRSTVVSYHVRQAESLSADEIGAMREQLRKDYAADDLPNVDRHSYSDIDAKLTSMEKARRTRDTKAKGDLRRLGDDIAKRHAGGEAIDPSELQKLTADFEPGAGDRQEIAASALRRLRVADAIRSQTITEVEAGLAGLVTDENGEVNRDDLAFGRDLIERHKKAVLADPIGVAERFGVIDPIAPLIAGDGDIANVANGVAERIQIADLAADHFGVPAKYFRDGEASQLQGLIDTDPDAAMQIGGAIVVAGGEALPAMLRELGKDAPSLSQSGAILASGGDPNAARAALEGARKGDDGKMRPAVPKTLANEVTGDVIGTALELHPAEAARMRDTAGSIARYRLAQEGIDPKSDEARPVFEQAVHEAAGARFVGGVQYGGFASYDPGIFWSSRDVLAPPNIRADQFNDVINAITEADLQGLAIPPVDGEGRPYPASQVKGAMPVATAGGYRFALGDPQGDDPKWVRGSNGNPFVLMLHEIPSLSLRVPGAFLEPGQ